MILVAEPIRRNRAAPLALRYALRELRGGLRGFYVFIACIALGVMAIAGVGSIAASLNDGLAREGRTLLGGDAAFSLMQREAKPDEVALLRSHGEVSVAATLRAMPRKVAAIETAPRARRNATSSGLASRWIRENARSPPSNVRPSRANPSPRLAATEPTPAIAITPSAMQAMKT